MKKASKKTKFVLICLFLILLSYGAFLFLTSQSTIFRLNEMGWRYDTFSISFDERIPLSLVEEITAELEEVSEGGKQRFEFVQKDGDIVVNLVKGEGLYTNFLIPVGHFYWIENEIVRDELGKKDVLVSEGYGDLVKFLLDEDSVSEVNDLEESLLEKESSGVGFVDLENLNNKLQVLYMDEGYFLEDGEGILEWGVDVDVVSAPGFVGDIVLERLEGLNSEFDIEDIGKINISGVTALSRNLAFKIENSGEYDYPAQLIGDFLADADIVHTSNEVSFVPGCRPEASMRFCSHPNYIKTLETAGVNVVELTGNHNNDFGAIYNAQTIEMYEERGWSYYGGGLNTEDASEILYLDLKDAKIAFIGYNYYDSIYNFVHNLAGENRAGANSFSFEKMRRDIQEANDEGAISIVTFQFQECYSYPPSDVIYPICYRPLSNPDQKDVFRRAVDYGADLVIGSQAHQPQTYEIYKDKLIFYGTGNLFFDQIQWIGTRQGMVLSHYIHEGRILQSKISTTLYDSDMQPYVSTGEDRQLLLELLQDARNECCVE